MSDGFLGRCYCLLFGSFKSWNSLPIFLKISHSTNHCPLHGPYTNFSERSMTLRNSSNWLEELTSSLLSSRLTRSLTLTVSHSSKPSSRSEVLDTNTPLVVNDATKAKKLQTIPATNLWKSRTCKFNATQTLINGWNRRDEPYGSDVDGTNLWCTCEKLISGINQTCDNPLLHYWYLLYSPLTCAFCSTERSTPRGCWSI